MLLKLTDYHKLCGQGVRYIFEFHRHSAEYLSPKSYKWGVLLTPCRRKQALGKGVTSHNMYIKLQFWTANL